MFEDLYLNIVTKDIAFSISVVNCNIHAQANYYFIYLSLYTAIRPRGHLFISRFGIKSGICLLIVPVPVHCFSLTYSRQVLLHLVTKQLIKVWCDQSLSMEAQFGTLIIMI